MVIDRLRQLSTCVIRCSQVIKIASLASSTREISITSTDRTHLCNLWDRNTVKLVYKDHPRDQRNVVLIHLGGLYMEMRFNNMESMPLGTCKMWSL